MFNDDSLKELGCPDCHIRLTEVEELGLAHFKCSKCNYWLKHFGSGIITSKPMVLLLMENISEDNCL